MDAIEIGRAAAQLIVGKRWLALATLDQDGGAAPSLGYVPFAVVDGVLGIVASRLAPHTAHLLARRPASILVVDDDPQRDAYAQPRLSLRVAAEPRVRGSWAADATWSALEARHGATVGLLRTLPDFEAIALEPLAGRLILGFASAHDLGGRAIADALRALDGGT